MTNDKTLLPSKKKKTTKLYYNFFLKGQNSLIFARLPKKARGRSKTNIQRKLDSAYSIEGLDIPQVMSILLYFQGHVAARGSFDLQLKLKPTCALTSNNFLSSISTSLLS